MGNMDQHPHSRGESRSEANHPVPSVEAEMKYVVRSQTVGGVVDIPEGSVGIRLVAPGERERDFRGSAWLVTWLEPVPVEESRP